MKIKHIIAACVLGATLGFAQEGDCICFELKGEMGKELKALIEKYHGEIAEAKIRSVRGGYDRGYGRTQQGDFSMFTLEEKEAMQNKHLIAEGKPLYERKCKSCHGENAEKRAYGKSRPLKDLSKEQMLNAIIGYTNNTYDRGMAFIMRPHAASVTESQMESIAAYIKSLNPEEPKEEKTDKKKKPTVPKGGGLNIEQ